jgi:hypothetical protein
VLPPAVHAGTVNDPAAPTPASTSGDAPRALDTITAAFGVEYRVNGDGTLDVGTQAQLYRTTPVDDHRGEERRAPTWTCRPWAPASTSTDDRDYSTRVLLLGSSTTTARRPRSPPAPRTPRRCPTRTRGATPSPADADDLRVRADHRVGDAARAAAAQPVQPAATALKVTATDYEIAGNFVVGDNAYVYDPDNGIVDAARSIDFRGEVIHPDVVRISGATWPVTADHTVAFRTNAGAWVDLTRGWSGSPAAARSPSATCPRR